MIIGDSVLSQQESFSRLMALPRGSTIIALGGTDTGKTTWIRESAQILNQAGRTVALVDCDLGQGEIGPPGTIGMALARPDTAWRALRDLTPLGLYFVGAISPSRCALDVCVGACQMARVAKKQKPDIVLVDTDGLIAGTAVRAWKRRMAELLLPQAILGFARGDELVSLLSAFGHLQAPELWPMAVSGTVERKTPAARATRRSARFLAAFADSQTLTVQWEDVALLGTSLGLGKLVPHHLQQFLTESLRVSVLYAAQLSGGVLYLIVKGERWDTSGLAAVESYFQARMVIVVAASKFSCLLVGLVGASGHLLGIGTIAHVDFANRALAILTPCRKPRAIAQIWLGALRVRPDGKELGEVRAGEI